MDFIFTAYLAITVTLPAVVVGFIFDPKNDPHGFAMAWGVGIVATALAIPVATFAFSGLAARRAE